MDQLSGTRKRRAWPRGRPGRKTLLAVGCLLLASLGLAFDVDLLINPPALLRVDTFFYDQTGHAGLVNPSFPYFPIPGAKTEIFFDGNPQPAITVNSAYYSPNISPVAPCTPFTFRITIPTLGVFEGSSFVAALYPSAQENGRHYVPYFVIPTTPAALGSALEVFGRTHNGIIPGNGHHVSITCSLNVGSEASTSTYSTDFHATADARNPKVTVVVDYLPGCSLYGEPRQSRLITSLNYFRDDLDPFVYWGGYPEDARPTYLKLGDNVPVGPVRCTIGIEGYTTDTIRFSTEDLQDYFWNAFFIPLPPPSGGDRPEGLTFLQSLDSIFPQIRDAIEAKIAPAAAMDQNHDGAVDAADLLYFLSSAQPLPGGLSP